MILTLVSFRSSTSPKDKPKVVDDYNHHMLGVDKLDQLMSYYSFMHKSVKWWRKVFFWCIEVAVVNAFVIHQHQARRVGTRPLAHLPFRRRLIEHLSEPIRCEVVPTSLRGPKKSQKLERLQPVRHFLVKGAKRIDCVVCSKREEGGVRHLTLYVCGTCSNKPHLCPAPCFEVYHTQKHYRT